MSQNKKYNDVDTKIIDFATQKPLAKNVVIDDHLNLQLCFYEQHIFPNRFKQSQFIRDAIREKLQRVNMVWPESIDPNKQ